MAAFASCALSLALPPASFAQIETPTASTVCEMPEYRGTAVYDKYCGSGTSAQTGGGNTAQQQILLNGASNVGYALGSAFARWLFSPGASQAQQQRQAYMQELQRQREEAQRQHNIEVEQQLEAMIAGLTATMKLHGLPDLQLKSAGIAEEMKLKTTETQGYGIAGLPGIYTGGPRGGSQPGQEGLSLKLGDSSVASQGYGIPGLPGIYTGGPRSGPQPGQEALNSQSGGPSTGQQPETNVDFTKITPEQAAQLAKAVSALPADEQQKILEAAQGSASANAPASGSSPAQQIAVPDFQPSTRSGNAASPTLLANVESSSLAASTASTPEGASAGAGAGFDSPAGGTIDVAKPSQTNPNVNLPAQNIAPGVEAGPTATQAPPAPVEQASDVPNVATDATICQLPEFRGTMIYNRDCIGQLPPVLSAAVPVYDPTRSFKLLAVNATGEFRVIKKDGRSLTAADLATIPLEYGDTLLTGPGGSVRMLLPDQTVLSLEGGSEMDIDDFLVDPANVSISKMQMKMTKGTLRFVTDGASDRPEPRVKVALGAVGIRGTDIEIEQSPDGSGFIKLHSGLAEFTPDDSGNAIAIQAGQMITWSDFTKMSGPVPIP